MRVIITGSRNWTDAEFIRQALMLLPKSTVVVHGGQRGADTLAARIAGELGLRVEAHPADWGRHGRAAGPLRNQEMLDAGADLVLAFPLPDSRGTWDMVRRAEKAGITTKVTHRYLT